MTAQVLFGEDQQQYILLQLDDALLNEPLVIKPAAGSGSVLCSSAQTFSLKDVQQSNSLLFLAETNTEDELVVQGEATSWLEPNKVKPSIHVDLDIHNPDDNVIGRGIPAEELFSRISASDDEIRSALSQQMAIDLIACGGVVQLQGDYVLRMLATLINIVQGAGMQLTSINETIFREALAKEEEETEVLIFLLHRFSSGADPYCLDGDEICRHTGEAALKQVAKFPCSLTLFSACWQDKTPVQFRHQASSLALMDGHYVQPASNLIQYFAEAALSSEPKARLAQLFAIKGRWREQEISTFLASLVDGDVKAINSLIMKFARKTKIGKETFIEARG
jgi:hypothetical protein